MTKNNSTVRTLIIVGVIAVAVLALAFSCIVSVPTGHTGVAVTFGKVEDYVLSEGVHFKLPWQKVVNMDNRTQKESFTSQAFSSDIQQVELACSVNFSVNRETSQDLYRSVGEYYYQTVMQPRVLEDVKAVIARYSADKLVESRDNLSTQIQELLKAEMDTYGIHVISVSVENIDFSDVFTNAVEAKQVAEQAKLQAQIEQQQKTMEQEAAADRQKIAAEADATVARIQAEADRDVLQIQADAAEYAGKKDAAVNEALSSSLTDLLIRYYNIKQWDGKLPSYIGNGTTYPILQGLTDSSAS